MEVPFGHVNFGRLLPCTCKVQEMSEHVYSGLDRSSNLQAFGDKTFANFEYSLPGLRDAFLRCQDYAENPHLWLMLLGGYGCGKTHLAAAIANEAVAKCGLQTYFAIAPDLLDSLRAAYAPNSESSYDDRFEAIRSVPLLVVDDLGTENTTPWAREKLYQIFNHRYNHRLATVVTSNVDLDSIEPRIRSRLCDTALCTHLFIPAGDYRQRGAPPRAGNLRAVPPPRAGSRKGKPQFFSPQRHKEHEDSKNLRVLCVFVV